MDADVLSMLAGSGPWDRFDSSRELVDRMIDVEVAVLGAAEDAGVAPRGGADQLARACAADPVDVAAVVASAVTDATPVVALVEQLRARCPEPSRPFLHRGLTSQDIIDSALMLLTRDSLGLTSAAIASGGHGCGALAVQHRGTPMLARTLLQPARPVTFGLLASAWLAEATAARDAIVAARRSLVLQLGGPTGTGIDPPELEPLAADRLGLAVPVAPWHTNRAPVRAVAQAATAVAAFLDSVAQDVVLLSQAEIGELTEAGEGGRSSAMPGKRNAARSVTGRALAHVLAGTAATVRDAPAAELQRAAGGWQAEWALLPTVLRLLPAAAARAAQIVESLEVNAAAMAQRAAESEPPDRATAAALDRTIDRRLAAWVAGEPGADG